MGMRNGARRCAVLTVLFALALCLLWTARLAAAQSAGAGTIQGTIADTTGAVLADATVSATNTATGIVTRRTTAASGFYVISPLIPGTYTVTVRAVGFTGYTVPAITSPGKVSQTLNVGNYVNGSGAYVSAGAAPGFADFTISGRAPEFQFWNFGIDRSLSNNVSISVNYAGSESHFIAGASNIRGLYAGQVDPKYYALGGLLTSAATATNVASAQAIISSVAAPYS